MNPRDLRPKRDWAIVLLQQRKTTLSSGLYIPAKTNHEKLHEGAGYLVRIGPGKKAKVLGLQNGLRVMFRDYLQHAVPIETDARWSSGVKEEYFFIAVDDIIAVLDMEVEVGLLSEKK